MNSLKENKWDKVSIFKINTLYPNDFVFIQIDKVSPGLNA